MKKIARIFNSKNDELMKPRKDWAYIACGYPFIILVVLFGRGAFFSQIIISQTYHDISIFLAIVSTGYFLLAGVKRFKRNEITLIKDMSILSNKYSYFCFAVVILFCFSYVAFAHGITSLIDGFATEKFDKAVIVSRVHDNAVRRGNRSISVDGYKAYPPSRAFHISSNLSYQLSIGDEVRIIGRSSFFGIYVDSISKFSGNSTSQPLTESNNWIKELLSALGYNTKTLN